MCTRNSTNHSRLSHETIVLFLKVFLYFHAVKNFNGIFFTTLTFISYVRSNLAEYILPREKVIHNFEMLH